MSIQSMAQRGPLPSRRTYLAGVALAIVLVVAAVWLVTLLHAPADSGSLDARVTAVGATVRCPVCKQPIPLNDEQNMEALQMRQFIREQLQQGRTEDQVRQELVQRYGPDILLEPPQGGFDLLAWLVPLGAVAACAIAVLFAVRRWAGTGPSDPLLPPAAPGPAPNGEIQRYEDLLDQELAARE